MPLMPLIKGKDIKPERSHFCGAMLKSYPIGPDQDLLGWIIVSTKVADEGKWCMQSHMHLDMTEYWFVLEGSGQIFV